MLLLVRCVLCAYLDSHAGSIHSNAVTCVIKSSKVNSAPKRHHQTVHGVRHHRPVHSTHLRQTMHRRAGVPLGADGKDLQLPLR